MERCEHLLAVCSAGAGYDVIDVEACTRAGIAVCNNSGPGAEAVAEHALGFMLDLAKKITVADRVLRAGRLGDRLALRGSQLLGKTLGVIGLGAIGSRLVELCAPFGMDVLVFDPYLDEVTAHSRGVQRVTLAELLERSDFVQVTCPLTAETDGPDREGPVRRDEAHRILHHHSARTSARRGGASRCAVSGGIAGAGLDVFHEEPPRPDNPLLHLDNVVATPHTAGITSRPRAISRSPPQRSGRRSSTVGCRHGCSTLTCGPAIVNGFTTNSVSVPPRSPSKLPLPIETHLESRLREGRTR